MFIEKLPIGVYVEKAIDWMTDNFANFFTGIKNGLEWLIEGGSDILLSIPALILIAVIALFAWWVAGN